jgi:hypothetical protein
LNRKEFIVFDEKYIASLFNFDDFNTSFL